MNLKKKSFEKTKIAGKEENALNQRFLRFPLLFTIQSRLLTNLRKQVVEKRCRIRRKCWQPAFSPYPTGFSVLSKRETIILATFHLLSANDFSLDGSKILLFGKELTLYETTNFKTGPNSKHL